MLEPDSCKKCPFHIILPKRKKGHIDYLCFCRYDGHFIPMDLMEKECYACQLLTDRTVQYKDDSDRNLIKEEVGKTNE